MATIISKSINSKNIVGTMLAPETLTDAYALGLASSEIYVGKADSIALDIKYAEGATEGGNTIQMRVEIANPIGYNSPAASDWMLLSEVSSGTISASEWSAAPGSYQVQINVAAKYIKLSFKETGVVTNAGTVGVRLITIN